MKRISMVLGIGVAGLAGYLLEPVLVSREPKAIFSPEEAATDEPTPPQESVEETVPEAAAKPTDPAEFNPFESPATDSKPDPSPFDLPPVGNPSPEPPPSEPTEAEQPVPEQSKVEEPKTGEAESPLTTDAEGIIHLMKASFGSGTIKEFASGKPKEWKATEPETIDGVAYQTGLVSYEADTILGPQVTIAKALIRNGTLVKWVSAKTGMEVK